MIDSGYYMIGETRIV